MVAEMHNEEGSPIYFNGPFKLIVGAIITTFFGLVVLLVQSAASDIKKTVNKNSERVSIVELAQVGLKKDLDYLKKGQEEQKRLQEEQNKLLQKILARQRSRDMDDDEGR